jgi:hypothetical protein
MDKVVEAFNTSPLVENGTGTPYTGLSLRQHLPSDATGLLNVLRDNICEILTQNPVQFDPFINRVSLFGGLLQLPMVPAPAVGRTFDDQPSHRFTESKPHMQRELGALGVLVDLCNYIVSQQQQILHLNVTHT